MVTGVITAIGWIVIVPMLVVHRNLHFWWIAIVHIIAAAIIFVTPEILWIKNIRIMVETVVILGIHRTTPGSPVSLRIASGG